jgi:hypothetical protein
MNIIEAKMNRYGVNSDAANVLAVNPTSTILSSLNMSDTTAYSQNEEVDEFRRYVKLFMS